MLASPGENVMLNIPDNNMGEAFMERDSPFAVAGGELDGYPGVDAGEGGMTPGRVTHITISYHVPYPYFG